MARWRFTKEILHRLLCRSRQGQRRADLTESAYQEHRPSLCRLDGRERVQGLAMASPETICLRRRQLRRRVDEDRVNSTATRRLVQKRRRNILRNFADVSPPRPQNCRPPTPRPRRLLPQKTAPQSRPVVAPPQAAPPQPAPHRPMVAPPQAAPPQASRVWQPQSAPADHRRAMASPGRHSPPNPDLRAPETGRWPRTARGRQARSPVKHLYIKLKQMQGSLAKL